MRIFLLVGMEYFLVKMVLFCHVSILSVFCVQSDKHSIIQMASKQIQELNRIVEELKRRNLEVEASLGAVKGYRLGGAKIRLSVPNPASGLDSMVEVLKCLKTLGLKTRTIRSNFSAQEFSTELEIETEEVLSLSINRMLFFNRFFF